MVLVANDSKCLGIEENWKDEVRLEQCVGGREMAGQIRIQVQAQWPKKSWLHWSCISHLPSLTASTNHACHP